MPEPGSISAVRSAADALRETVDALEASALGTPDDQRNALFLLRQLVRDAGRFGDHVAAAVAP